MENLKEFVLLFKMLQSTAEQIATMYQQWQNFIGSITSKATLIKAEIATQYHEIVEVQRIILS